MTGKAKDVYLKVKEAWAKRPAHARNAEGWRTVVGMAMDEAAIFRPKERKEVAEEVTKLAVGKKVYVPAKFGGKAKNAGILLEQLRNAKASKQQIAKVEAAIEKGNQAAKELKMVLKELELGGYAQFYIHPRSKASTSVEEEEDKPKEAAGEEERKTKKVKVKKAKKEEETTDEEETTGEEETADEEEKEGETADEDV